MLGFSESDYSPLAQKTIADRSNVTLKGDTDAASGILIQVVSRSPSGLRHTLARMHHDHIRVSLVFNPAEALARASVISPNLVILDVGRDVLCAAEICRQFRRDSVPFSYPVLVLLCPSMKTYRRDLLGVGAVDCLAVGDDAEEVCLRITSLLGLLAPHQCSRTLPFGPEITPLTPMNDWAEKSAVVQAICTFMISNMGRHLTIQDLEQKLGLPGRQLKNRFEAEMGVSIFQWHHSQKMSYARKLIEQTEMRMEDIALALGYLSSCNFSTAVRGAFGSSPRDLRRNAKALPQNGG